MGHNGSARRGGGRHCALRHPQRTVCRAWFKPPGCRVVAVDHVDGWAAQGDRFGRVVVHLLHRPGQGRTLLAHRFGG